MRLVLCEILILMAGSLALAEAPPLDGGSSREQILDALNARGQGLKDFVADVSLAETDALNGETTTLMGKVWYQAKGEGDARMRILFEKKLFGDKPQTGAKVEYVLDKGWLNDRDYKLKVFDVKKVDTKQGDPEGTVHLELAPKPNTDFARKFKKIDVWVETKTSFPRRIATVDKSEAETRTTDLTNINVNVGLKDDAFVQEKIGEGWTQKSEQME